MRKGSAHDCMPCFSIGDVIAKSKVCGHPLSLVQMGRAVSDCLWMRVKESLQKPAQLREYQADTSKISRNSCASARLGPIAARADRREVPRKVVRFSSLGLRSAGQLVNGHGLTRPYRQWVVRSMHHLRGFSAH